MTRNDGLIVDPSRVQYKSICDRAIAEWMTTLRWRLRNDTEVAAADIRGTRYPILYCTVLYSASYASTKDYCSSRTRSSISSTTTIHTRTATIASFPYVQHCTVFHKSNGPPFTRTVAYIKLEARRVHG